MIIKNCPCLFNAYYASGKTVRFECNDGNHEDKLCCDVADCLLKQIVDKCYKATHEDLIPIDNSTAEQISRLYGRVIMADEILNIFEIEECENEQNDR